MKRMSYIRFHFILQYDKVSPTVTDGVQKKGGKRWSVLLADLLLLCCCLESDHSPSLFISYSHPFSASSLIGFNYPGHERAVD